MNRRKFLGRTAGSAIGIGLLALPETADAAMGARIDSPLEVFPDRIHVFGSISHWDADAESAVFVATISQNGHTATGTSRRYYPGAKTFSLIAYGHLRPGKSVGHGAAHIMNRNGSVETYTWTVPVELVQ